MPFGPIRQMAFMTRNLDESMRHFTEAFGIGPWFHEPEVGFRECLYRGASINITIGAAIAYSGDLQIELIRANDDTASIYTEFLDRYPRQLQLQHINVWVDDLPRATAEAIARGFELIQTATTGLGRLAYLSHPDQPDIALEISDLQPAKARMFEAARQAARNWEGAEPYRRGFPLGG